MSALELWLEHERLDALALARDAAYEADYGSRQEASARVAPTVLTARPAPLAPEAVHPLCRVYVRRRVS